MQIYNSRFKQNSVDSFTDVTFHRMDKRIRNVHSFYEFIVAAFQYFTRLTNLIYLSYSSI
jgi:hypothetical protein